jgi:hypothetical protein
VSSTAAPTRTYHHACSSPGFLVIAGNDTTSAAAPPTGAPDLYLYNIAANTWTAPFDYVTSAPLRAPFVFVQGGYIALIDEAAPNALYTVDSAAASGPWSALPLAGAPMNRIGQRFLSWGSTLFMLGGFDPVALVQYNDLLALDMSSAITGQPQTWTTVSPAAAAGGAVAGYPPPRFGYSWTSYQVGAILYGGLSIDTPGASPFVCFRAPTTPGCHFHTHVWAFLPGLGNAKVAGGVPAGAWVMLNTAGANGGPTPAGRVEHVAGAMGDQMYIYGGLTAAGPSTELWTYNLVSQTWAPISASSPSPQSGFFAGWSSGAVIGRHLYIYQTDFRSSEPGQLWRWAPSASFGGPPVASACAANAAIINGHTAGIAISVLLLVAVTALTTMTAQALGVVPACGLPGCRSPPSIGPAGFYSSSSKSAAAAAVNGGYVAPPGDTI